MPKLARILLAPEVVALATGNTDGTFAIRPKVYLQKNGSAVSLLYRYRSPKDGKGKALGLGSLGPLDRVELRLARLWPEVELLNGKIATGTDPLIERKGDAVAKVARTITLGTTFTDWMALHIGYDKKGNELNLWTKRHAFAIANYFSMIPDALAETPISDITNAQVADILNPLVLTTPVTAKRFRRTLEIVFGRACALGHYPRANPAALTVTVNLVVKDKHKVVGHRMTEVEAVPAVYAALAARTARGKRLTRTAALQFAILTWARAGNIRTCEWQEIDLDAGTWTVPGSKMKNGVDWVCPLSQAALALLATMPRVSRYVFPGTQAGQPAAHDRLDRELKSVGSSENVHGFRAAARSWSENSGEEITAGVTACEYQLAHLVGSKTTRAYAKGGQVEIRRGLVERWAAFVTSATPAGNVVNLSEARRA